VGLLKLDVYTMEALIRRVGGGEEREGMWGMVEVEEIFSCLYTSYIKSRVCSQISRLVFSAASRDNSLALFFRDVQVLRSMFPFILTTSMRECASRNI
jgi:hypothetical protein